MHVVAARSVFTQLRSVVASGLRMLLNDCRFCGIFLQNGRFFGEQRFADMCNAGQAFSSTMRRSKSKACEFSRGFEDHPARSTLHRLKKARVVHACRARKQHI